MKKSHLLVATCAALLFVGACKKNDEAKPADNSAGAPAAAKPTDNAPAPAPAPPPAAAPSSGGAIANAAEYQLKSNDLMTQLTSVFVNDGKDCDKLAADVDKWVSDNKAELEAIDAYEKAHPDDKKAFDEKSKDRQKAFEDAASPALDACKSNKALTDALSKVPG